MLIAFTLALLNAALTWFGTYVVRLPGFDLTPMGIFLVAQGGESILLGAVFLNASYILPKPSRLGWAWLQFPSTVLLGYLSFIAPNPYLIIILYHVISVAAGLALQMFDGRYVLYTLVNIALCCAAARIATLLL
ncbi:hypothetical protein D6789_03450 [Candidatus Woesearchaeota archaeon]|nr:MAG: hypothetical protein D6789_03450 [Candidatus Woesearchaeota archaeon]